MILLFLSLIIISVFVSAYALHTSMTEEEYIIEASKKQTTVTYGRSHPMALDPALNRKRYRIATMQTLALS
jgi:hypothetical protein